ncbi:cryptochrome/photolyase family protein [Natronococcus occultus]|uniref:Deoxyribodipyrimidine photolyase n=1 Tax=Natronococcus occultus SP4 TaxID=694430 RepID=L0JXP2_9EURY|nr:deoxyribodipyrimidine photo-lyase [Natronococcus occultus]AGB37536.1 deoxyribodipyrimidine photolyase [Natronococcus occultus SP4]
MILHWHRSDLRAVDNRGLARAARDDRVLPLYVLDPTVLEHASPVRVACLLEALGALRSWYRDRGGDVLVVRGDASEVLPAVATDRDAARVVWNEDVGGLAQRRDSAVRTALEDVGVDHESVVDGLHHEPGSISPNEGEHYSVFSYFWKKWRDREKADPAAAPTGEDLAGFEGERGSLPSVADLGFEDPEADPQPVTRTAARERLEAFCSGPIYRYADDRDVPAAAGTSRLSVHFKWGTIGPREVYAATERAREDAESEAERESVTAFRRQLAFREFYAHVLAFNPESVTENLKTGENAIEWRNDPDELAAWTTGETGYPIVDAGMRQLRTDGWVHNRVRMLAASFLTKDLLIDWRKGYDWYRRHLADHETASDVAGWQWAASTGADAQPYFRVFNPMKQGREYDPDAEYIREHVPELADVPAERIHEWDELVPADRAELAPAYPEPIVDHSSRRSAAIEAFERASGGK